jgi:serralysin
MSRRGPAREGKRRRSLFEMSTTRSALHPLAEAWDFAGLTGTLVPALPAPAAIGTGAQFGLPLDAVFGVPFRAAITQDNIGAATEFAPGYRSVLSGAETPLARAPDRPGSGILAQRGTGDGGQSALPVPASGIEVAAVQDAGGFAAAAGTAAAALPVYSYDQIAHQLTHDYWGGTSHSFAVQPGDVLYVDISALAPAGRQLALWALDTWSTFTGITFNTAPPAGARAQITMDDAQPGGSTAIMLLGTSIYSAHVNIGPDWLATYGTSLDSYSYYSYLHELGHALGLGHAGNYNDSAVYGSDAQYLNDSWQATVMSYFDQQENTYINATYAFAMTPMIADIIAVQNLYGVPTGIRGGNTVYGENSTAGSIYDRLEAMRQAGTMTHDVTLTIFDQGGFDTLDLRSDPAAQRIDLRSEAVSDIYGLTGVLAIARGTQIERVLAGSGSDTITGNAAANALIAGLGNDVIAGGNGNDTINGGAGNDRVDGGNGRDRVLLGAGRDIFTDNTQGGALGRDTVFGGAGNDTIRGGAGDDRFYGDGDNDLILGGAGNDTLFGGTGADTLDGGAGNDRIDAGQGRDRVMLGAGADLFTDVAQGGYLGSDTVFGGAGNDTILGSAGNDRFFGDGGNDLIQGGLGNDVLYGGAGDDVLSGGFGADTLFGGAGADVFVFASVNEFSSGTALDQVADFATGQDRLLLSALTLSYIGTAAFSNTAGELRFTSGVNGGFLQGDTDGNGTADFVLFMQGVSAITAGDLIL